MATLFVVGTPIGNLEDITQRAIRVLKQAHRVAAEDTRHSKKLLAYLGIQGKPVDCIESHQSDSRIQALVEHLIAGQDIALVTDAGMPGVSDPGSRVVRAARAANIRVEAIPGPSAVTTAVAASGLVEGPFRFVGFLPRKGSARKQALDSIAGSSEPVVLFEAPTRAQATLTELAERQPTREICVGRELTKLHEEYCFGSLAELAQRDEWRGELTFVLGSFKLELPPASLDDYRERLIQGLNSGEGAKGLAQEIAEESGLPRRDVYQYILTLKGG